MTSTTSPPIVVDLDGTLTPIDTLIESFVRLAKSNPAALLSLPSMALAGRAALKEWVATKSIFEVQTLPINEDLFQYLREEHARGRRIVLATAAHESIARAVANRVQIFECVISTSGTVNMKGTTKLAAIRAQIGDRFVYAGDSSADLPIWHDATAAILVGTSPRISAKVAALIPIEKQFHAKPAHITAWLGAIRFYQWVKNILIFVPLFTSFGFLHLQPIISAILAFISFSLVASATYVLNDIWDIDNDRQHPRKRRRAFASAEIPIQHGALAAAALLAMGFLVANALPATFAGALVCYVFLTSAYSWVLKTYVLIDVLTLAVLYTLRILAGSIAIGVTTSSWLLALSVFLFLSLAIVKRCAELVAMSQSGQTAARGRDYQVHDLTVLWPIGIAGSVSAVLVFGLYISDPLVLARYGAPEFLWLAGGGLLYWLSRLWIKTSRGEMHDDPIVFAARDRGSRATIGFMVAATLAAYWFTFPLL